MPTFHRTQSFVDRLMTHKNIEESDRPFASCITQDSVVLKWFEPVYGTDLVKRYHVYYGPIQDSDEEWKKFVTEGRRRVAVIQGLRSETRYTFKVYAEGEYGVAPDSDSSLPIRTHKLRE